MQRSTQSQKLHKNRSENYLQFSERNQFFTSVQIEQSSIINSWDYQAVKTVKMNFNPRIKTKKIQIEDKATMKRILSEDNFVPVIESDRVPRLPYQKYISPYAVLQKSVKEIRTDLVETNKRIDDLDKKIDHVEEKLTRKINDVEDKLTRKINDVEDKLTRKINDVEDKLTRKINDVEERLTKKIDNFQGKFTRFLKQLFPEKWSALELKEQIYEEKTRALEQTYKYSERFIQEINKVRKNLIRWTGNINSYEEFFGGVLNFLKKMQIWEIEMVLKIMEVFVSILKDEQFPGEKIEIESFIENVVWKVFRVLEKGHKSIQNEKIFFNWFFESKSQKIIAFYDRIKDAASSRNNAKQVRRILNAFGINLANEATDYRNSFYELFIAAYIGGWSQFGQQKKYLICAVITEGVKASFSSITQNNQMSLNQFISRNNKDVELIQRKLKENLEWYQKRIKLTPRSPRSPRQ